MSTASFFIIEGYPQPQSYLRAGMIVEMQSGSLKCHMSQQQFLTHFHEKVSVSDHKFSDHPTMLNDVTGKTSDILLCNLQIILNKLRLFYFLNFKNLSYITFHSFCTINYHINNQIILKLKYQEKLLGIKKFYHNE